MTVVGYRTYLELKGTSCIELDDIEPEKKQIIRSRSFGKDIYKLEDLKEAISMHASRASEKLRQQKSIARYISVWIKTNAFKDIAQYKNSIGTFMPEPTNYFPTLIQTALTLLEKIYKDGYGYKKAGVMLDEICPDNARQLNLFSKTPDLKRQVDIMKAFDQINLVWGRDTIKYVSSGIKRPWSMKRAMISPRYTTNWDELPIAKAS